MEEEKFWVMVKRLMEITGTTLETLAIKSQIPLSTLKGWLRMNYFPTVIEGYRIARTLRVSVEYLITGEKHSVLRKVPYVRSLLHRAEKKRMKVSV